MRLCIMAALMACINVFPLAAQTGAAAKGTAKTSAPNRNQTSVFIHIMPITGEGGSREASGFIAGLLAEEAKTRDYVTISSPKGADYLLIGTLAPYTETTGGDFSGWEAERTEIDGWTGWEASEWEADEPHSGMYVFNIKLQDNLTKRILAEQDLIYSSLQDFARVFPVVMNNIFSYPLVKQDEDTWRNKWLYAKAGITWTPRVYQGADPSTYYLNFGGGIGAEFQFLNFMSAELNIEIAPDWIMYDKSFDDRYLDLVMEIPLIIKYIIKPSRYFMIEPYAGIQFNVSLFRNAIPPLCSWLVGLQYGVKAGKGAVFVEPRVAVDIGRSSLNIPRYGIETNAYRRLVIYLGVGYKYGFFTRNKK